MAAIGAIATMLKSGDHVVVSDNVYGGTFRLFDKVLTRYQLSFTYVDTADLDEVERAITPATRLLFVETPTNPVMRLTDLRAAADLAHRHGLRLVVDNTFASPYIQRPIEFGADLVMHSTTKYLNGHSDSVGGVVVATRDDDIEWLKFVQNAAGAILGPFDSWLVLRGTKTLPLRMAQHNANGLALAQFLAAHPKVKHVYYPGLPSHPQHELARRQMRGFGGMLAFELGSLEAARRVLNSVRLMSLAESLGGVETLISHPATMTHASVPARRRAALGITDGLVRISAGIEDIDDLQGRSRAGARPGVNGRLHRSSSSTSTAPARARQRPTARGSTGSCSPSSSPKPASSSRRSCRAIRCCSRPARWPPPARSTSACCSCCWSPRHSPATR